MAVYEVDGVEESDGEVFKTLPHDIYEAEIVSSVFKEISKEGDYKGATMLMLTVSCEGPEFSSTAMDTIILPWKNMTDEQKRKSKAKLKKIQIACDLQEMGNAIDNEAFLHATCRVELIEKDDKEYGMQNKIKDYLPL